MTAPADAKTKVDEAARALAAALQEDPRWAAWQDATAQLEKDTELHGLMERYQQLAQKAQQAPGGAEALAPDELEEITSLQKKIQENERFAANHKTSTELVQSLREGNQSLSAALGLDFAATAAAQT